MTVITRVSLGNDFLDPFATGFRDLTRRPSACLRNLRPVRRDAKTRRLEEFRDGAAPSVSPCPLQQSVAGERARGFAGGSHLCTPRASAGPGGLERRSPQGFAPGFRWACRFFGLERTSTVPGEAQHTHPHHTQTEQPSHNTPKTQQQRRIHGLKPRNFRLVTPGPGHLA